MDKANKNQQNDDKSQKIPVSSVGTLNKEGGIRASVEVSEKLPVVDKSLNEYVKPSEQPVPNEPQAGISASGPSVPAQSQPTKKITFPDMTEEEADKVLKKSKRAYHLDEYMGEKSGEYTEDSAPFLATLIKKFFEKMRFLGKK